MTAPAADTASGKNTAAAAILAAAVLACVAAYAPARSMGFYFDDTVTVLQNEKLQSDSVALVLAENPFRVIANIALAAQLHLHRPELPDHARSLANAAPMIELLHSEEHGRQIAFFVRPSGDKVPVTVDPARGMVFPLPPALPFRLFNLGLHILNCALLFLVLRALFGKPTPAAACAAIVMVHPLATESVNYISARFGLLAMTFSLAAILAIVADLEKPRWKTATLLYALAMLSKETAAILPAVWFLLLLGKGLYRPRALWALALGLAYFILRLNWRIELGPEGKELLSWPAYLLVQQKAVWVYLGALAMPAGLNFEHSLGLAPLVDAPLAALNAAILAGSGYIGWKRLAALRAACKMAEEAKDGHGQASNRKRDDKKRKQGKKERRAEKRARMDAAPGNPAYGRPAAATEWAALLILIAAAALSATSSVIPLADPCREARAYPLLFILASPLVMLAKRTLAAASPFKQRGPAAVRAVAAMGIVYGLLLLGLTFDRNLDWRSELALAADGASKSPYNARAAYNYANALKWKGRYRESVLWFQRTIDIDPTRADAASNIEALKKKLAEEAGAED